MKSGCDSQKEKKQRSIALPVLPNATSEVPEKTAVAHSKAGRWRAFGLITLNVLMIAHIIQWRLMGKTVTPIEPSEAMYTIQNGAINAGFIFFSLAILATLIFGRFVCGWACHIVALQDFCGWLLKKMGLTPRPFRSRLLIFVPLIVALYMFVWPTVYKFYVKAPDEPLFPAFTNHLITEDFWQTFPPWWVAIPFLFICGFMTVYFLGQKGFCTYACPYGGFFGVADQIAPGKIRVTDACNNCGHCTAVCTSNVIVHAEVKEYGMVVDPGCMKCMDCVSVCPNDALYFGFGKPALGVKKTVKKNYSLTWPEEIGAAIVFFLSYMAVWDVYQLVPMLMALGVATVTTFLAFRVWRIISTKDVSFYRYNLKSAGIIKRAGWIFLALSTLWIGLNAHSGYVHYHESAGGRAFVDLKIPDELALARSNPARWLSPADQQNIASGKEHLRAGMRTALFENHAALPKLAWFEYLSGNNEEAIKLLSSAEKIQHGQVRALSLYYKGAILNRIGRNGEALVELEGAIKESPSLIASYEEKGEALWMLGRKDEAVATWRSAMSSGRPIVNNMLAGVAMAMGDNAAAANYEAQAARTTPNDPLFHWMLGLRLQNVGMNELAEKHFQRAIQMNPEFRKARS